MKSSHVEEEEPPTVKIKISGDGARMSHSSSLFVCSFSLLEEGQHVLSSAGRVYSKLSFSPISTKSQAQYWKSNIIIPNNKYNNFQWQEPATLLTLNLILKNF